MKSADKKQTYKFPNGVLLAPGADMIYPQPFSEKRASFQMAAIAFASLDSLSENLTKQQAEAELLYIQLKDASSPREEALIRKSVREHLAALYSTADSYKRMIINLASLDA